MQISTAMGKKHLAYLGKLLMTKRPDIARELTDAYFPKQIAFDSDLKNIRGYYQLFCQAEGLQPDVCIGRRLKSSRAVEIRYLFVSTILHLYYPDLFVQGEPSLVVKHGFYQQLASALRLDRSTLHGMVRQLVVWESRYDDYRANVEVMTAKVKALSAKVKN